jgi:iron complex outermembrane receptor protein
MNETMSRSLFCAFGVWGLCEAPPVVAQDQGETVQPAAIADVIVTARRMEERSQDVPISITVFNQEQIDNRNVLSARDLATYTPSLSANSRFGTENTSFAIRGFSQELRTTASVAVYFADVVAPRSGGSTSAGDGAGPGSFFDLQNVQVLKGPQGTLFGRNTTGGAVLLVPRKPTAAHEGYLEASYGDYDLMRAQGVGNLPLGDSLRLRVGIDHQTRDGYLDNISGVGPEEFSDIDYTAARVSLVADLSDNVENYTIASYTVSDNNGPAPKITSCVPALAPGGPLSCDQLARQQGRDYFAVEGALPDPQTRMEQWQVINTTTWLATDDLTLKNIASYAELANENRNDGFGTNWIIPGTFLGRPTGGLAGTRTAFVTVEHAPGKKSSHQSTFSEEIQVQGRGLNGALSWQAGAYFEQSKPLDRYGNQNPQLLSCTDNDGFECFDPLGRLLGREGRLGSMSYQVGKSEFRNLGVYSQATYSFTDRLALTGGIRYTSDRTESAVQKVVYRFSTPNNPVGFCLNPALRNPAVPIASTFDCEESFRKSSDAPTWVVGLDYKPVDDVLLYGKYSRGYRQGSTNPYGADGYGTYEPEQVDAYELGAKTSFSGAVSGLFNIAAFYNDFSDQQLQVGFRSSTNSVAPNTGIVNAGKSRIYGVEVESSISPFDDLTLDVSYAYLNTKIEQLAPVPIFPGSLYDLVVFTSREDAVLPFSPKHKASATATYNFSLPPEIGTVALAATYSYTDEILVSSTSTLGILPSYELVNLNLNWNSIAGSRVDAALFATNIANERYYTHVNDQGTSGFVSHFLGEPRMYGVRVRVRFGE